MTGWMRTDYDVLKGAALVVIPAQQMQQLTDVYRALIDEAPQIAASLFEELIGGEFARVQVLSINYDPATTSWLWVLMHAAFQPMPQGAVLPRYEIWRTDNGYELVPQS